MHSLKNPSSNTRVFFRSTRFITAIAAVAGVAVLSVNTLRAQPHSASTEISAEMSVQTKRDSMTITLEPLKRIEVKLVMKKGQKAEYTWNSDAEVTYNLHGEGPDAPGGKAHTYSRGESRAEKGEIVALFDGVHGWSWRNTTEKPVRVTVTAWGQFQELKKM
ncbi:MAG: hypothetical protein ABI120_20170 [Gemmatimonadaceae bacterium]